VELAKPSPVETWTVVVRPDAWKDYPKFHPAEATGKTLIYLRRTFARWKIRFRYSSSPPVKGNLIELGRREGPKNPFRMPVGRSMDVDEWNREVDRLVAPDYGVWLDNLQALLVGKKYTVDDLAQAVASIAAHEIGHSVGLYHFHGPRRYVMETGTPVLPGLLRWSPQSQLYLDFVLGLK
jgi:hypothetical protein